MKNTPLISSKKLIPVKYILIYKLREEGRKYKEIGLVMNVTEAYACMIYKRAKFLLNSSDWDDGLTLRARKCLKRLGINSKEDAMTAYTNGKLYFKEGKGCVRNYGWGTHKEVARWLDQPEPKLSHAKIKNCPHCGASF